MYVNHSFLLFFLRFFCYFLMKLFRWLKACSWRKTLLFIYSLFYASSYKFSNKKQSLKKNLYTKVVLIYKVKSTDVPMYTMEINVFQELFWFTDPFIFIPRHFNVISKNMQYKLPKTWFNLNRKEYSTLKNSPIIRIQCKPFQN